jgi:hypothetical protein
MVSDTILEVHTIKYESYELLFWSVLYAAYGMIAV